jgi:hypothetical protein
MKICRKELPLKAVPLNRFFYWTESQCFGGQVLEHLSDNNTLFLDSGCDGNTYTKRIINSDIKVWIE